MDIPYYVERDLVMPSGYGQIADVRWVVKRSGFDDICWCNNASNAYLLADLLNHEARSSGNLSA